MSHLSYYNRPWQGRVQILPDRPAEWIDGDDVNSVEAGLERARQIEATYPSLPWRIVDAGGNVYAQKEAA